MTRMKTPISWAEHGTAPHGTRFGYCKSIKHRRLGNDITRRLNAPGHELVLYNAKSVFRYRLSLSPRSLEVPANTIAWLNSSGLASVEPFLRPL